MLRSEACELIRHDQIGLNNTHRPFTGVCAVFRSYFAKRSDAQNTAICKSAQNQILVDLAGIVKDLGILTRILPECAT